jgi:hypothetical protein
MLCDAVHSDLELPDLGKAGAMPQNLDTHNTLGISRLHKLRHGWADEGDSHHASYQQDTSRILRVSAFGVRAFGGADYTIVW